jgi:hypothetical protein
MTRNPVNWSYHYLLPFSSIPNGIRIAIATHNMRFNRSGRFVLSALLACTLSACGERRAASPLSPSLRSSPASDQARRAGGTLDPRRADNDGDGYDDGDPPSEAPPDPGTGPLPDPGTEPVPDPNQPPLEELPPAPIQLTITVVGTFGEGAFVPNPLQAAIGNTIVWTNNDFVVHDIVFDDGTPVGMLAPGQSSVPIALLTDTVGYRCTLHPSMVGQVVPIPVAPPIGTDPSQPPTSPDPNAPPPEGPPPAYPPYDDGGSYPDYGDDYYLRIRR